MAQNRIPLARPVERGITISLTVEEWRSVRDALTHALNTGYPLHGTTAQNMGLRDLLGIRIKETTGNPMD